MRKYYSKSISEFLTQSNNEIAGIINGNTENAEITVQQENAWQDEITILKNQLSKFKSGQIIFEYAIPRMGKKVDTVIIYQNIIFLLEFKCGDDKYRQSTYDQVYDYALDLHNFHKQSEGKLIVPIMVSTAANKKQNEIIEKDRIIEPLKCNSSNIGSAIIEVSKNYNNEHNFDYKDWENSEYYPTPTIVEAARAMYEGHNVKEITRSDAGAINLTVTTKKITQIIDSSKKEKRKSICFVTGVPGAGKTLVGLQIAIEHSDAQTGERAVFLSGNFPLVTVLQEALARDKVAQKKQEEEKIKKTAALRETSAFIQNIHKYRDSCLDTSLIPPEHIAIFDEAQRAWTLEAIKKFMKTKKGINNFQYSEPEFLIETMNRHEDWAVIICLVGGGQEINTGEAGLPEWFDSLRRRFKSWDVYITPQLNDNEYRREKQWNEMIAGLNIHEEKDLHLSTSVRSFRTPDLAAFVKAILDINTSEAQKLYLNIKDKYPIVITRDLNTAKKWILSKCQGTTRYGLLASSGALRLKPEGIFVKNTITVANWFLNGKTDVRSSYMLEDVVTEFDIQGLELDYSIVAWDADLRFLDNKWSYHKFSGDKWNSINKEDDRLYLKNAYRVLLTRARQGMVIFIPKGSTEDQTRNKEWYDNIYQYLKTLGITEL